MAKFIHDLRLPNIMANLALLGLVLAAYLLIARPYQLRWGATDEEVDRSMPGDDLSPSPMFLATRAITIEGTPAEIWPWLVQMGYGRAGFYGYDILENLGSKRGIRSAEHIVPELQHFSEGDPVPISAVANMAFHAIEPNEFLIWMGEEDVSPGVFTWALYPMDERKTRLVSRIRWSYHWTQPGILGLELFTEFADHIAVRKVLLGVRDRVAGRVEPMIYQNMELAVYVAALLFCLAAVLLILLRPLTLQRWLVGVAAGATWLITWYAPISIWIGVLFEILLLWGMYVVYRRSSSGNTACLRSNH